MTPMLVPKQSDYASVLMQFRIEQDRNGRDEQLWNVLSSQRSILWVLEVCPVWWIRLISRRHKDQTICTMEALRKGEFTRLADTMFCWVIC